MTQRINYSKASPDAYRAFGEVHSILQKCGLAKELINLVYLRVSQINGCAFCIDMHTRDLKKLGVSEEKLTLLQVWHDAGTLYSAREKAAIAKSATSLTADLTSVEAKAPKKRATLRPRFKGATDKA